MPTPFHVTGPFQVKMLPQPAAEPAIVGRALLDKQYHGDLAATALGQMLSAVMSTPGSAGYVAIEQVTGTLLGRSGSFVLMHTGVMDRSTPQLSIVVVPDSGTDGLLGLSGRMDIQRADGQHTYVFEGLLL